MGNVYDMTSISIKLLEFILKFIWAAKWRTGFTGAKKATGKCLGSHSRSLDERNDGLEMCQLRLREAGALQRHSEESTELGNGLELEDEEGGGVTHELRERKLEK